MSEIIRAGEKNSQKEQQHSLNVVAGFALLLAAQELDDIGLKGDSEELWSYVRFHLSEFEQRNAEVDARAIVALVNSSGGSVGENPLEP